MIVKTVLENGLTVLTREAHSSPVVTCWACYRVGSRHERPGVTGSSHWVEHMLFKGGREFGKGEIFRQVSSCGGYNNGFTSHDLTVYFETLPADRLEMGLRIEADRMVNAVFDQAEVEAERTVIISELEGAENQPPFLLHQELNAAAFRYHPYRWPVLGWKGDLRRITRDDLYSHYRTFYAPSNCVLVLVGDFQTESALDLVRRHFGGLSPGLPAPEHDLEEPVQEGERAVQVRRPGGAAYLEVGYHVPAIGHPDLYPLMMLDTIFSGAKPVGFSGAPLGKSGRLERALVHSGLASEATSSLHPTARPGLYTFWVTAQQGVETGRAEQALLAEIERAAADPPAAEELAKGLRQTQAQFAYGQDGVTSQAMALGMFECLLSYQYFQTLIENLERVSPEQVKRAAQTYLGERNRTVGVFRPTGGGAK